MIRDTGRRFELCKELYDEYLEAYKGWCFWLKPIKNFYILKAISIG